MMQRRRYQVAVLGATGAVGRELLRVLDDRRFPAREVVALASSRSVGERVEYGKRALVVQAADPERFDGVDLVLCGAPAAVARQLLPEAASRGATCLDSSGAFLHDPQVPLIVPELNPEALLQRSRLIALPRSTTTLLALPLAPLHAEAGLRRVVVCTYHSASGAGRKGIDELSQQTIALLNQRPYDVAVHAARSAFNVVPQVGGWGQDGQSEEEEALGDELRRLLDLPALPMSITAAQVPVFAGHCLAVHVELEAPLPPARARALLDAAHGVEVLDAPEEGRYPMPMDCGERDEVFVGRIRPDASVAHGLAMWIAGDNLRVGAAGAVRVASLLDTLWNAAHA